MSVEKIILTHSAGRGIHKLRSSLAPNFCEQAAEAILAHPGKTLIATGFYVAGTCETDGPVGAIALADALKELDSEPVFVTDRFCAPILRQCSSHRVIDFPILSHEDSRKCAAQLLATERPSLLISIERCGMAADGRYYNMRGDDISEFTAKLDWLFDGFPVSIGIGDGGNEIGMGNLAAAIAAQNLPIHPCVTRVTFPVIATVSNWGAYGMLAYLSRKRQRDFLNGVQERKLLERLAALGVVDGVSKQPAMNVDGFSLEILGEVFGKLQGYV
ncbi:hypothetical protein U14_00986 [Candidatus Moduliflexus flocculans]|uniref:D-glutamate cyclase-like C-terminal domain-containing protein n=1 Tax=Candidatus Moduliflexus flocculans TaxID=1499966 RepID=A0A0S6VRF4_9BACT|nr:hypothetical protein U14_00986 [Candidatus Moduliflexus flocculans]